MDVDCPRAPRSPGGRKPLRTGAERNAAIVEHYFLSDMERWRGKVAIVTGASVGIGAAIALALAKEGLHVVALARRLEKLRQLSASAKTTGGKIYPIQCDVAKEEDILKAFEWTEKELGRVDVLVNNAGMLVPESIIDGSTENYRRIMDVNVIGMVICSREAIRRMRKQSTQGHIFNLNSIAGHFGSEIKFPVSLYVASKYAITGMCTTLRNELMAAKVNVKITSISPGIVKTDMSANAGLSPEMLTKQSLLEANDVVGSVIYALSLPSHAEVNELIITPHQFVLP